MGYKPVLDLTGQTYAHLTVLRRGHNTRAGRVQWWCRCVCGAEIAAQSNNLRSGNTTSCGCVGRAASAVRMVAVGQLPNRAKPDDEIAYTAAHDRVRKLRGSARTYRCVDCDGEAFDWSLRHDSPSARLAGTGKNADLLMSPNPDDYEPRCKRCHHDYDNVGTKAWRTRRSRKSA